MNLPEDFSFAPETTLDGILAASGFRMRTKELEENESWRQLIPYQVVFNEAGQLFFYRRRSDHAENRLAALYSLGIGGHLEEDDFFEPAIGLKSLYAGISRGMRRELEEEIKIGNVSFSRFVGFIQSHNPPVDRVHLGLVYAIRISGFSGLGEEIAEGAFEDPEEISRFVNKMENWSRLLCPHLDRI